MSSGLYIWSQTPAGNANADSTINWAEGMAPSAVNDSARAVMAGVAKYRDDIAGAIVTGGTSTAYTVTSYSVFDTLAHMNGQMIAFSPHTTNGATVTLNVDSLGAKPLRTSPGVELLAGTIIQGTPYTATYNNSDGAFYLQGFYSNPYNVPLMGGMDFWDTIAPNSSFIFPAGQAISRTTYSVVFARWGTTYGAGDGSTTFNVPDKTGRISAMKESSATRLTSTYFGGNSTTLGAVGGGESQTLTAAQIPSITSTGSATMGSPAQLIGGATPTTGPLFGSPISSSPAINQFTSLGTGTAAAFTPTFSASVTSSNTSGNAHPVVQPTIVCNYIIRII